MWRGCSVLVAAAMAAVAAGASAQGLENGFLPVKDVPYYEEAPGQPQRLGPLWGDRATGPAGTLLKVPAGFEAPLHAHTADYRAVVIEGEWAHWVPETGEGESVRLMTQPLPRVGASRAA